MRASSDACWPSRAIRSRSSSAFSTASADSPGGQVAPIITGAFDDPHSLERLAAAVDLVTYEFENVPVAALQKVAATHPVWPPVEALRVSQDRLLEKQLFTRLRIPTPPYRAVDSLDDLRAAVKALGLPCVLKTRRLGYDGKGQRYLRKSADLEPAWTALGNVPLILEGFVDFEREVSIVGVRSTTGEVRAYPIVANTHKAGILRVTLAPHRHPVLQKAAEIHLKRVLRHFEYAGVLTLEFFVRKGKLVANEMAPRVHNSGHWTIEGATTSQFENHLRAILGLPLGDTEPGGTLRDDQFHRHDAGTRRDPARCPACTGTTTARSRARAARSATARSWRRARSSATGWCARCCASCRPAEGRLPGPVAAIAARGNAAMTVRGNVTDHAVSRPSGSRIVGGENRAQRCTWNTSSSRNSRSGSARIRRSFIRARSTPAPRRTWSRRSGSRTASS